MTTVESICDYQIEATPQADNLDDTLSSKKNATAGEDSWNCTNASQKNYYPGLDEPTKVFDDTINQSGAINDSEIQQFVDANNATNATDKTNWSCTHLSQKNFEMYPDETLELNASQAHNSLSSTKTDFTELETGYISNLKFHYH